MCVHISNWFIDLSYFHGYLSAIEAVFVLTPLCHVLMSCVARVERIFEIFELFEFTLVRQKVLIVRAHIQKYSKYVQRLRHMLTTHIC